MKIILKETKAQGVVVNKKMKSAIMLVIYTKIICIILLILYSSKAISQTNNGAFNTDSIISYLENRSIELNYVDQGIFFIKFRLGNNSEITNISFSKSILPPVKNFYKMLLENKDLNSRIKASSMNFIKDVDYVIPLYLSIPPTFKEKDVDIYSDSSLYAINNKSNDKKLYEIDRIIDSIQTVSLSKKLKIRTYSSYIKERVIKTITYLNKMDDGTTLSNTKCVLLNMISIVINY